MFDYMDFKFYSRWILISNVCWILSLFHAGVNCEVNLEIVGSHLIGSSVNFTCTNNMKPQFYAKFFKDGQYIALITPNNSNVNDIIEKPYTNRVTAFKGQYPSGIFYYILKLDKLQCSDEGNYTCEVNTGSSMMVVKPFQLKTNPLMPHLAAPTNFVVLGDLVTLNCTANVGKPPGNLSLCASQNQGFSCNEVSTLKDLGNCSYSQTTTMTFNITEDTNQATCEINGTNLKVTQDWKIQYPVLDIKFVPDDFQIIMMEGQNKVITCEARGNPTPTYKWEFQPQNSVNPTIFQSQKLNLNSVRLEQTGKYTCIASNNIRNDTYNMTKTLTVNIVPTTPAPTTTIITSTVKTSSETNGNSTKTGPQTNGNSAAAAAAEKDDGWKLIVGIVGAILFLIILIILLVILYRQRSKPAEIEEPPEKPRNNHEVNMKETKPDLVYSTGIEKGKLPMYNTGFDHNGEDDLYYAELAFDDKPRSRKPVVPLYDNSPSSDSYKTVMPHV